MKLIYSIILIVTTFTFVLADAVITEWKADPGSDRIVLQWKTSSENGVEKFIIEKSTDNQHFAEIGEVASRGPGFQYRFVDENLEKLTSLIYYRLKVVNNDGTFQFTDALPVIPNISSISRTWGSIKALFR